MSVLENVLKKKWGVISYGGGWDILSVDQDIVAVDVPHGSVADHIVKLHNDSLEGVSEPVESDLRPLEENVVSHAMEGGYEPHSDGRVCVKHHRLGVFTPDGLNECLRPHIKNTPEKKD